MPQVGDHVKLFLPEHDENEAFVRTIVRNDGGDNKRTQNVDKKYLGNTHQKQIKLSPDELKITSVGGGAMEIRMTDGDGIEIKSNKDIKITSQDDIFFDGKTIKMTAKENIALSDNFSSQTLHDITHFKGDLITINGTKKI